MTAAAKTKTARKPTTSRTASQLMATPEPMLAWLRSFTPRSIVTRDTLSNESCLFANFLKAHGRARDISETLYRLPSWFADTLNALPTSTPITAQRAIAQIHEAIGKASYPSRRTDTRREKMPFDNSRDEDFSAPAVAAPILPVQAFAPASDDVLQRLIKARAFIANPDDWCCVPLRDGHRRCAFQALMDAGAYDAPPYMRAAALSINPEGGGAVAGVNVICGHAGAVLMYDRAIAARRAELAS